MYKNGFYSIFFEKIYNLVDWIPFIIFKTNEISIKLDTVKGAQWLSGRELDLRPRGSRFEPHMRYCVVVLEQDTFILA